IVLLAGAVLRWRLGRGFGFAAALLLAAALGFAAAPVPTKPAAAPMLARGARPRDVTGRVLAVERQEISGRILLGDITVDRLPAEQTPATARIQLTRKSPPPEPGASRRRPAVLAPPAGPVAPGAFDFRRQSFF